MVLWGAAAEAAEWIVEPAGSETSLAEALARAAPGDTVRVRGGSYPGPVEIDRPLEIIGEGWPRIDGSGQGTVVAVRAPGVVLRGFHIRGSGDSLDQENSGLAVEAPRATVEGNRFEDVLFGIYLREAPGSAVRDNVVLGKDLALPRRGDAIRVWYSDDVAIDRNRVADGRDVVLWYSERLQVSGNRVSGGRYGLHFMYCDDATIRDNLLLDNSVGAFLMYSRRLRLVGNTVAGNHGPSGYGVGLKDMDDAVLESNRFVGNRVGAFLDNSPREMGSTSIIERNIFAGNDFGILLLPNVRRTRVAANSFVENQEQVAIAGPGGQPDANDWQGNYWSDYAGYDADGDGAGDIPYRADRLFESLADRYPGLRLFLHSPVTQALDLAARAFPLVAPRPKLTDSEPRMRPHELPGLPLLAGGERGGLAAAAGGMLAAALLLVGLPRLRRTSERRAPAPASRPTALETAESTPIIRVEGLSKAYGSHPALDRVSFTVGAGESVALWGPNGAGKTTALRALLGVIDHSGTIRVRGLDPLRQGKQVRRLIGFVPQEIALQGNLGIEETLEFFARLRRTPRDRIPPLVARLGLADHLDKPFQSLSGGLKQRLALGAALLADPPILLLDEPTANLDAAARGDFLTLLLSLKGEGKTLVFSSHRMEEVVILSDRVLHLDRGRLVGETLPDPGRTEGSRQVELRLLVRENDQDRTHQLLDRHGFSCRRLGPYLLVPLPSNRKVEPLSLLFEHRIELLDFGMRDNGSAEVNGARTS